MNPILTKNYAAGAAINPCRFVKMGSSDYNVIQATDGSAAILGASEQIAAASGERVDVVRSGLAYVELGDTVTRGQHLTSDSVGRAIPAVIVAGTALNTGGQAEISGVAGDIIPVMLQPSVIANDTGIVTVDVTVATGELLALNATPKQLVAAPGALKAIILVDAQAMLDYNSAAYAGIAAGEDLQISYTNGAGVKVADIETTGFLDATADAYRHVYPLADAAKAPAANAALVLSLLSGEITTGNSPLKLRVRYRTVDLAF